jgi:hypothetical protein
MSKRTVMEKHEVITLTLVSLMSMPIIALIFLVTLASDASAAEPLLNREELASQIKIEATGQVISNFEQTTTVEQQSTVENEAVIEQSVTATANTGGNSAERNISFGGHAGVIETGNATVVVASQSDVNSAQTQSHSSSPSGVTGSQHITTTGTTAATSTTSTTNNTTVAQSQSATVYQSTTAEATTGNNTADRNISFGGNAGMITTGAAQTGVSYLVAANQGLVIVGGYSVAGPSSGSSIYVLDGTTRITMSDRRAQSLTDQQATVIQMCGNPQTAQCSATTGNNSSNRGIAYESDAGVIHTGDAVVFVLLDTVANDTSTSINGGSGTSTATQSADVAQSVQATANTGNNTADRNISFGAMQG